MYSDAVWEKDGQALSFLNRPSRRGSRWIPTGRERHFSAETVSWLTFLAPTVRKRYTYICINTTKEGNENGKSCTRYYFTSVLCTRIHSSKTRLCTERPQNRIWEWLYAHRHLVWNRRRLKLEFRRKTPPLVVNWCSRHAALPGCGNFSPLGPNSGWWRTFSNVLLQCRAALLLMWWPGPGEISRHRLLQLLLLSNEQCMWCWCVRNSAKTFVTQN